MIKLTYTPDAGGPPGISRLVGKGIMYDAGRDQPQAVRRDARAR